MHSKLIRLQTALLMLALLFTVLLPVPAYALEGGTGDGQVTDDGSATTSDPNTMNAWAYTQAYNNATTGRIWADKTVEDEQIELPSQGSISVPKDKGADFLVALSALSSYASTTTTNTQALDIVMVLDASGSMDDPMGGGDRTKRMDALKAAVNNFITIAKQQNAKITDKEKQIQLSIVKFAGKNKGTIGNDTYRDGMYTYNYSQIVKGLTVCDDTGAAALQNAVNAIKPAGATRADLGLKHAQTVLKSPRPNAKQVVIFFTDGSPNNDNGFDNEIASDAIKAAKSLKDAGTVVYTVGIFDGADPKADVSKTSSENKFMQAVSSNYPLATYDWIRSGLFGWDSYWSWNFGTKPDKADYYLAASSADGLKTVFEDIFKSVSTKPAGPTHVTDKPETDGYVTFDDPLGDYMVVKSFEAVAFSDQVFKQVKTTQAGNVDTYIFEGEHTDTVSGAYPETANLKDIIITVTHGSGAEGDRVQVKIPASMLPLRYYQVTNTDGKATLKVNDAQPISVIYSVGLNKDARAQIASGSITDPDLAAYVAKHAENGKISFYSNKFDKNNTAADGKTTIGSTTATFTPATSNNFYYHTEDTLLYTKVVNGETVTYEPVTNFVKGTTYYYELNYLHQDPNNRDNTLVKKDMVPMHIDEESAIAGCIGTNKDGYCYIKAGTKKGSLPSAIDNQLGDKKDNTTGTAKRRIDFQWDLDAHKGVLYLGNNGKLTMNATGSLKVTKNVVADEGLHPKTDAEFTMKFELAAKAGETLDANATYNYTVTGNADTKTIKSGDTFKLKNGETAEIVGLPAGSTYTITEEAPPAGYTSSITNDGTGEVKAGTAQEVTVTNTYNPAPITVNPDDGSYPFEGKKILTGRKWKADDKFTFQLQAVTDGAPLPDEADGKRYAECVVKDKTDTADGTPVKFNFGRVTFTKPGEYVYDITEVIPTDNQKKIPGVSYDSSVYRVTVTITDDGNGQLKMENSNIEKINGANTNAKPTTATFTNIFENDTETLVIEATKVYKDETGTMDLTPGQFHFKLEPAKVNESNTQWTSDTEIPMPNGATDNVASAVNNAYGTITFEPITYTRENNANQTYYYLLTEQAGSQANVTYSQEQYLIKAVVSAVSTDPLSVTTTYYKWDKENNKWDDSVTAADVTFTNTFTGETKATLGVSKSISGRGWNDNDSFTFTLKPQGDVPMPTENTTVEATKNAQAPDFGTITYKKAGEYKYIISEGDTTISGMAKAPDVTATVKVTLDSDNNLQAEVKYSNYETVNGEAKAKFVNTYNATPYTPKAKDLFQVEKDLQGREWNGTDTFYFTLSRVGDAPLPTSTTASVNHLDKTATIGGDQQLEFNAAGTYTYFISENSGSIPGVTYDKTQYKVVVDVKDNNGKLEGTTYYYKSNDNGEFPEGVIDAETNNVAKFTNIYHADNVNVTLQATKQLYVVVGNRTLNRGEFSFELREKLANDTVSDTPITAENDENGNVTFNLPAFTSADVGKKTYVISEVNNNLGGIGYDTRTYEVTFTVEDNGEGKLVASPPPFIR